MYFHPHALHFCFQNVSFSDTGVFIHSIGSITAQDPFCKLIFLFTSTFSYFASTPEPPEDMDDIVPELNLRVTSVLSTQVPVYSSMPQLPNDFVEGITNNLRCCFHVVKC